MSKDTNKEIDRQIARAAKAKFRRERIASGPSDAAACSPCPFCGGSAEVAYADGHGGLLRFEVRCIAPDCRAKGPTGKRTAAEAEKAWNTTIMFRQANDNNPPTA